MKRYQVVLHDVSPNGVAFWLEEPLAPGTIVGLQRIVRSHIGSWVRSGRVMHSTPSQGKYLIGCLLSPPFAEDEIQALG